MAAERTNVCSWQGSEESHSSRLFREGRMAPDAQDVRACKGDFRKVRQTPC